MEKLENDMKQAAAGAQQNMNAAKQKYETKISDLQDAL